MKKRDRTGLAASVKNIWEDLNQSIFVGNRLRENVTSLTFVSLFCVLLGIVLTVNNMIIRGLPLTDTRALMSLVTILAGAGCAFCCRVLKRREIAILIPVAFSVLAFTVYALTGYAEGTGILWSLMVPIGVCYFISVRAGILISVYYSLLYFILFLTPLGARTAQYYTAAFTERFPLAYFTLSVFTAIAMIQYHRYVLLEIRYTNRLNEEVARQTAVAEERAQKIEQMSFQTIQTLANAIDAKDPYTRGHSTRVSQYSVLLAQSLGWDADRVSDLRYAALLHDIGKIGVPDSILNNPKRLTDAEYAIIKSHTTMGGEILRDRTMVRLAEDVARSHHERYDGKGYPGGLKGTEISEEARIVAIADAFDAMSSNRIYRKACNRDHILTELNRGRGTQFDPDFAGVFIGLWEQGELDEILKSDTAEEPEQASAPSSLLQEVVEAFASQNAADSIDIVTGIMSRSAGEGAIARRMQQKGGCFVFFDIDNLKPINDTHGHEYGDRALRLMGDTLQANSGDGLCCRLGGDEFLLFLPGIKKEDAELRVRKILAEFDTGKQEEPLIAMATISAGLVMCSSSDTYISAYNRADKAMYSVKQSGKNGYTFYNPEIGSDSTDINRLLPGIRASGRYDGALDVDYRQFARLYDFIENLERRFNQPYKLVLITLEPGDNDINVSTEEQEKAMYYMEQAIRQTIRNVDVLTRYSSRQYLVILVGTGTEGVKIAVDRMFRGYYKMNGSGTFSPSYTVADPEEAKQNQPG